MRRSGLAWLFVPFGCTPGGFACMDDGQCGAAGVCELEGWCSFPDAECSEGRRFGTHAGDGLGGRCVPPRAGTSSSSGGTSTTVAMTTSIDASSIGSSGADESSTTSPVSSSSGSTGTPADSSTGEVGDQLLLWLDFDDAAAPWTDKSGLGNDASCADDAICPTLDDGVIGKAARFDGHLQYLQVAGPFEMSDAFTLAAWIHSDTFADGTYHDVLTRAFADAYDDSWGLGFPPQPDIVRFVIYDGVAQQVGGDAMWPPLGGWHHVAATWDGMTTQIYLDGGGIAAGMAATVVFDDHPVLVGADLEAGMVVNYFAGMIDEVRIYARALSDDEIAVLAAG